VDYLGHFVDKDGVRVDSKHGGVAFLTNILSCSFIKGVFKL
jgi:hypothetical protein